MRRLVFVTLVIFSIFMLASCNKGGSSLDLNFDEQLDAPTNLRIDGTILSWNSVPDAKGYIVYANDEKIDTVEISSYDFVDIIEDRIIFRLITKAPRGMQDSTYSASIAYMKYRSLEISKIDDYFFLNGIDNEVGFAEELVNKGMLADEFIVMMEGMDEFTTDIEDVQNMQDYFDAFNTFMMDVTNVEAIVSALIKTQLPKEIKLEIDVLEQQQQIYQEAIDYEWAWDVEYYQERIDELQDQIDTLKSLSADIRSKPDQIIQSVMAVMNYMISIQEMVTDDLINAIENLSESDELSDINVDELVLVKEELVHIFTESMPEIKDITVLIKTMSSFSDFATKFAGNVEPIEISLPESPEKMAGQMLMSIEAFLRFIDNLDKNFFQTFKDIDNANISDFHKQAKAGTLLITYFDSFKENNQGLLDDINDIYTDDEKEELFNEYVKVFEGEMDDLGVDISLTFMTYEKMMKLETIFGDAFDNLLDAFVESEGEIFTYMADRKELRNDFYYNDQYSNNWYDYSFYDKLTRYKIIDQVVHLLNSVISDLSRSEYEQVSEFLVQYVLETGMTSMGLENSSDYEEFKEDFMTFYASTLDEQYALIKNILDYLDKEDFFLNFANDREDVYDGSFSYIYEDEKYFMTIYILRAYNDLMTRGNKSDINILIDALEILLKTDFIDDQLDSNHLADSLRDLIEYLDSVPAEIRAYNLTELSNEEKADIDEVIDEIQDILYN